MKRQFSSEDRLSIISRYVDSKESARGIGLDYGCSNKVITRRLQEWGIEIRPHSIPMQRRFNDEQISTILDYWDSGKSARWIGKKLGCSRERVITALKANGREKENRRAVGELHPNWQGGRAKTEEGYVLVKFEGRYALEHRLVMSEYLGRPLYEWETVHHINGDRSDNRLENLQLRIGKHGSGQTYCCSDCGSRRIEPVELG